MSCTRIVYFFRAMAIKLRPIGIGTLPRIKRSKAKTDLRTELRGGNLKSVTLLLSRTFANSRQAAAGAKRMALRWLNNSRRRDGWSNTPPNSLLEYLPT